MEKRKLLCGADSSLSSPFTLVWTGFVLLDFLGSGLSVIIGLLHFATSWSLAAAAGQRQHVYLGDDCVSNLGFDENLFFLGLPFFTFSIWTGLRVIFLKLI